MDSFRIANFEISDDSIPNFENSEADANALVQYAMRKRGQHHRGGGPLFQPKKNDATKAGFNVKVIRPTTTTETDAGIQQADFPSKILSKPHLSLAKRVLCNESEKLDPNWRASDEDLTVNMTRFFQDNPQAASTPGPRVNVAAHNVAAATMNPLGEEIVASTQKSVPIPGVEININLNHSKKTSPNPEINKAALPVQREGPSTPERHSFTNLTPATPPTPRYTNLERCSVAPSTPTRPPRSLAEKSRTPSMKDRLLAALNLQCNAAEAAKEGQASMVASSAVISENLRSPTHRVQRSLQFVSPKLAVQQEIYHDIATQPHILAPPKATITLKVVVDHQQNKTPSVPTENTIICERTQERTAGTEELQQTINNVESVNKLIFKTPHIPRIHTSQPIPLVNISQTLTSETDVDAFWLNFDDKMGGSPKESKISRTSFAIPRYINPHQIGASQTFNSQMISKRDTLAAIENLEKTIQESIRNTDRSTRRVLYRKRDPSPEKSKHGETNASAISKLTATQITSLPLNDQQPIGIGDESFQETCPDSSKNSNRKSVETTSRKLYPKLVLKRFDDAQCSKSIYHGSGENSTNTKTIMTTKNAKKRNHDMHDSEDRLQSLSKRIRPSKNHDGEMQSIPVKINNKNNVKATNQLEKMRKVNAKELIVEKYNKDDCLAADIHSEVRPSHTNTQISRQPYNENTLIMPIPSTSRTNKYPTQTFSGSHSKVLEGKTNITEDESDSSFQQTEDYSDSNQHDSPSTIYETTENYYSLDKTDVSSLCHGGNNSKSPDLRSDDNTQDRTQFESHQEPNSQQTSAQSIGSEIDISNRQYNESSFLSLTENGDESTLIENPQRQISVQINKSFDYDENSQEPTHSRHQSCVQLSGNRNKILDSPEDFGASNDDEESQERETSHNHSTVQSSVQDSSFQSSVMDCSRQSSVKDSSRQSTVHNVSRHSTVQDDNSKQTPFDSSEIQNIDNFKNVCKPFSIRLLKLPSEIVENSRSVQNSSKTSNNSVSSSSKNDSKEKKKAAKINKKRKFECIQDRYDPSKKRPDKDNPDLRRSKREYRVPLKYWTTRIEPISPIVLVCKGKSHAKPHVKKPISTTKKNQELVQAHLDVFNTEFSFLEIERNSVTSEQVTDLVDGVIVRRAGITTNELSGVRYWHYAIQSDKRCGYIRIPEMRTKKKTVTKKKLEILVLKGSVIVLIGENKNVAVQGDQIRINEGVAYAFENTGKTAALLYYTK